MATFNTPSAYGTATKALHWAIVAIFALQYSGGLLMTRMGPGELVLGLNANQYFDWHKSLGLVALAVAVARLVNRSIGALPDWAPTLGAGERVFVHRAEQALYAAMLLMPVSGFVFVMAGGYGVLLFGAWPLPNPIGKVGWLEGLAQWTHVLCAFALAALILAHVGLVLAHAVLRRDGLLRRML